LIRIKNAKKRREREKKEQEVAAKVVAKKQLSNVRVVQKNLVYVLGLPLKLATEEVSLSCSFFLIP
jgi:hypothetical protein